MKVQLISSSAVTREVPAESHALSNSERVKLAAARGGLFFFLAVASVFIPVFHFVLVPLFLILSVFFAFKTRKAKAFVGAFSAPCPKCNQTIEMKAQYLEDEIRFFCPHCRDQLKLTVE
jgi:hypothetical protein